MGVVVGMARRGQILDVFQRWRLRDVQVNWMKGVRQRK